jgi:hypothetical protein
MHNEFTAVFERDGDWYIAYCPEILRHRDNKGRASSFGR